MEFVLSETPRYWWPVAVHVPDPDQAGAIVEQRFEALFEPMGQDAAIEAAEAAATAGSPRDLAEHEQRQLRGIVKGWRGVVGADKTAIPFTDEIFAAATQQVWFRRGVFEAYRQSLAGEAARLGN